MGFVRLDFVQEILCEGFYVRGGFGVWVFRLHGFWCAWGCAFRLGLGEISLIDSK